MQPASATGGNLFRAPAWIVGVLWAAWASVPLVAETRFMQLSEDTVGGRRVRLQSGGVFNLYRNHDYRWENGKQVSNGTWSIAYGNTLVISFKNGRTRQFNFVKIDGELHFKQGYELVKIVSIDPLE
jgi:hypothetical protein